jgi:dienelactone hydrolase
MENDPLALPPEVDLEIARLLDATVDGAELFLYPGERHLFADPSLPSYDEAAATLATRRVLELLDTLDQ